MIDHESHPKSFEPAYTCIDCKPRELRLRRGEAATLSSSYPHDAQRTPLRLNHLMNTASLKRLLGKATLYACHRLDFHSCRANDWGNTSANHNRSLRNETHCQSDEREDERAAAPLERLASAWKCEAVFATIATAYFFTMMLSIFFDETPTQNPSSAVDSPESAYTP